MILTWIKEFISLGSKKIEFIIDWKKIVKNYQKNNGIFINLIIYLFNLNQILRAIKIDDTK